MKRGGKMSKQNSYNYLQSTNMNNNNSPNNELNAAKLAVIGAFIATVGDAISTLAAAMALEGLQQSENGNNTSPNPQYNQDNARIIELEKQVQYLMKENKKRKHKRSQ